MAAFDLRLTMAATKALHAAARSHHRAAATHRKLAAELMAQLDALKAELADYGIRIETNDTVQQGGHSHHGQGDS